jgi:hypothetical protein
MGACDLHQRNLHVRRHKEAARGDIGRQLPPAPAETRGPDNSWTLFSPVPTYLLSQDAIVSTGNTAPPFARILPHNPLDTQPIQLPDAPRTVMYSGWFPDGEGIDFRTWTPTAWQALDAFCDRLRPPLEACAATLCFRPHARHILADPQACLAFLKRREGQPFEVLLDAAAFLTPGMLGRAEDHLTRAFEALPGHLSVPAAVLTNVAPAGPDALSPAPLHRGLLDPGLLVTLARRHASHLPWILLDEDVDAQMGLLHLA